MVRSAPSQYAVRTLFRTFVAQIDGIAFQFRQIALDCAHIDPDMLSNAELSIIRDEKNRLDEHGKLKTETHFQAFLPTVLFSLRCFAKVWGTTLEPNKGDNGSALS